MVWFVVGLCLPCLAAYLLMGQCIRSGGARFLLRGFLAVGVGLGLSSCTYFLWLVFCGGVPACRGSACGCGSTYQTVESLCFAVACLLALAVGRIRLPGGTGWSQRHASVPPLKLRQKGPRGRRDRLLACAFGIALLSALLGVGSCYVAEPLGEWDAWAFWNQRARFLFRSGEAWQQAFRPAFNHPDYPLLLPATTARCWTYLGSDPPWVPWLVGSLFTFATVGVLVCGVALLRSLSQGLLAGMVLLGTVTFLRWGAAQYADVPLAFFFLATVLVLALYDATRKRVPGKRLPHRPQPALLLVAGLTAGLAAWTKNEGLLFVIVVVASRSVIAWRAGQGQLCAAAIARHWRGKRLLGDLAACAATLLPIMGVVMLLKMCVAPAADDNLFLSSSREAMFARILDPSRYLAVAEGFARSVYRVAKAFTVVLPICFLLLGSRGDRRRTPVGLPAAAAVFCLMLVGYLGVYLLTPYDLEWHMQTSFDRLLTQLWPMGILIFFLSRATPEELLETADGRGTGEC
jgi:hypothetical protein